LRKLKSISFEIRPNKAPPASIDKSRQRSLTHDATLGTAKLIVPGEFPRLQDVCHILDRLYQTPPVPPADTYPGHARFVRVRTPRITSPRARIPSQNPSLVYKSLDP